MTPQTALSFPRNGEPLCSPAIVLCLILQILSPAPSFAISRVYAFPVLPLPSFFFPTCASLSVRRKLILHSSFYQACWKRACWKRLCRESGARIPHGSPWPVVFRDVFSLPEDQCGRWGASAGVWGSQNQMVSPSTFTWELQQSPMLSLLPEEFVHRFFQGPEIQRR